MLRVSTLNRLPRRRFAHGMRPTLIKKKIYNNSLGSSAGGASGARCLAFSPSRAGLATTGRGSDRTGSIEDMQADRAHLQQMLKGNKQTGYGRDEADSWFVRSDSSSMGAPTIARPEATTGSAGKVRRQYSFLCIFTNITWLFNIALQ